MACIDCTYIFTTLIKLKVNIMKKLLFTLLISASLLTYAKASETNNYAINDQQVEQLFANSTEVNYTQLN